MAATETLIIQILASIEDFKSKMKEVSNTTGKITKEFEAAGKRISSIGNNVRDFGAKMSLALSVPVAASAGFGLKMAADAEQAEVAFGVMLKSGEKAKLMIADLQKFAAKTPFEFPEIRQSAQSLLAFGIEADKINSTLTTLGDVASGVNMPLNELAEIYGKAKVQGRLFGEDINQIQGRGINITKALAQNLGVTQDKIKDMVSEGKIGFPELEKAMQTLQKSDFAGMMEKQSNTLAGIMSTFKDTVGQSMQKAFEPYVPVIKQLILRISDLIGIFMKLPDPIKNMIVLGALAVAAIGPIIMILGMMAGAIGNIIAISGQLSKVVGIFKGVGKAGSILGKLSWLASPWGIAIMAMIAVAYLLYKNWDKVTKQIAESWAWLKNKTKAAINSIVKFFKDWGPLMLACLGPIGWLVLAIIGHWKQIKEATVKQFSETKTWLLNHLSSWKTSISNFLSPITHIFSEVWAGIKSGTASAWAEVKELVVGAVTGIKNAVLGLFDLIEQARLKAKGVSEGVSFEFTGSGSTMAWASGTMNAPGGRALVGENGPEIVDLPSHSKVYTANRTSRMMAGGGQGDYTITHRFINADNQTIYTFGQTYEQESRRFPSKMAIMPSKA